MLREYWPLTRVTKLNQCSTNTWNPCKIYSSGTMRASHWVMTRTRVPIQNSSPREESSLPQSAPYRPVTYISIPSLKVKMVVVLEVAEPCFRSGMLSYRLSPGISIALAGRCCSLGVCWGGGGGGGGCCKGCWGRLRLGRKVALALGGGLSRLQPPPPSMVS